MIRVHLNLSPVEIVDFDADEWAHRADDNGLLITKADQPVAQFPGESWLYVERVEDEA